MSPTDKKSSPYPYPSDHVSNRYQITIPKLPSLKSRGEREEHPPKQAAAAAGGGGRKLLCRNTH
jgi:hypothetical protein